MRSDHLSKHIKTHLNKKAVAAAVGVSGTSVSNEAASPVAVTKVEPGTVSANDQHTIVTMETLSAESIARLASSGINMMQVDLHQINGNNYWGRQRSRETASVDVAFGHLGLKRARLTEDTELLKGFRQERWSQMQHNGHYQIQEPRQEN